MSSPKNTLRSLETAPEYSAFAAARDLAAFLTFPIVSVYIFERAQVGDRSLTTPLKILGIAFLLIYLPGQLARWLRNAAPVFSESAVSLLLVAAAPIFGYLLGPDAGGYLAWPMALAGLGLAAQGMAGWWRNASWRIKGLMFCVMAILGIRLAECVYGDFLLNPIFAEGLVFGEGHTDTLCAMAMTQMAKNFAVSSCGLHGTPFFAYHSGAYWFLGNFGNLLSIDMVAVFNLFYPVVFVPLFIKALLCAAARCAELTGRKVSVSGVFLCAVAALTLSYLPMYDRVPLLSSEPYSGPAHALALYLCFDVLVVALEWWSRRDRRESSTGEVAACFMLTASTLAILLWFKISSGTMFLAMIGVVFLRMKLYVNWRWWIAVVGCFAIFVIEFPLLMAPNYSSDFGKKYQLFAFLRQYVPPTLWLEYYLYRLIPLAVLIALQCHNCAVKTLGAAVAAWREGRLLKSEMGAAIFVISQGPNTFMNIGFGAGENFVNASYWFLATMILSEVLSLRAVKFLERGHSHATWRDISMSRVGVALAMAFVVSILLFNAAYDCKLLLFQDLYSRGIKPMGASAYGNSSFINAGADDETNRTERRKMIVALRQLDPIPMIEKRSTALHIPKTNLLYWNMLKNGRRPQAISFVAPALSGLVSIDGVPEPTSEYKLEAYSFETYLERNITSSSKTPVENKVAVLSAAKRFGYHRVLVFDQDSNGKFVQMEWNVD